MKTLNKILLSATAAALALTACDAIRDFGDINYNPNSPSTAFTSYLFTYSCRYAPYFTFTTATNGFDPWLQEWNGYLSESKNNQYGALGQTVYYTTTSTLYVAPLKNLNMIIEMNEDEDQRDLPNVAVLGTSANQIAAAKTLSAFFYMSLTDILGPIVMSEAFKGVSDDNWTPAYDSQEEVYRQLDETLTAAYRQFDENGTLSSADILYNGNIAKWKKFNASLRMLMAIKLCDVDPATGKSRFAAAYADGGMETVADGFNYTYDDLNWNMLYYWCSPDYSSAGLNMVPNMFIVEQMKELKDNRMFKYFDIEGYKGARDESKFPRDDYNSFYGVPFGLSTNGDVTAWSDVCASINYDMLASDATVPVIPTARVLLTEAEAAWRGWISADPQALYEAGIKASFEQWGATGADAYVKSRAVAYDPANGLEQIAIQRWIASYLSDGVEAWSDWRRLDIPYLPVGPKALSDGVSHYPYRLAYDSGNDPAFNYDNYVKAVAQLYGGTDDRNSRVWWDVADNREGVLTEAQCKPANASTWTQIGTGDFSYTVFFGDEEDPAVDAGLALYQNDDDPTRYRIGDWGYGVGFTFTYDEATGEVFVDDQPTGYVHASYGDVYVCEIEDYFGDTTRGKSYYENGVFHFATIYYVSAGYFGFGMETFAVK